MTIRWSRLKRVDLVLFIACVLLFTLVPGIDLAVSGWFYDLPTTSFHLGQLQPVQFSYRLFANIHFVLLPLFGLAWLVCRVRGARQGKRIALFLLLSLLAGPGILANIVLKDNSIGRARPVQVAEFGGERQFTRAFEPAGQCDHNCSFVSGHAAMGFYFMALGWIGWGRRGFLFGVMLGSLVGLGRIIQGGHFLSDVVFAFWVVYGVNLVLGALVGLPAPKRLLALGALRERMLVSPAADDGER